MLDIFLCFLMVIQLQTTKQSQHQTMGLRLLLITLCHCFTIALTSYTTTAADVLIPPKTLKDGHTLVSPNHRFVLGFFSPANSPNHRYLGIWYKNLPLTVVWVANRDNPITNLSGELLVAAYDGTLKVYDGTEKAVWSSNFTSPVKRPILLLLDSGNLVARDEENANSDCWESFDYPSDTLLPEMKLGWNLKTGLHRFMTSWKTADDPSVGEFSFSLDPPEAPQLVLRRRSEKQYRWGPWDGVRFSGSNELRTNPVFKPMFNSSSEEVYYTFLVTDSPILSRFVVTPLGLIQYLTSRDHREWSTMVTLQRDNCDRYGLCGPYGNCYAADPNCRCLKGFTPKSPQDWDLFNWSGGCKRKWELDCGNGDGFVRYEALKLPDNSRVLANKSLSPEECRAGCLKNCSCSAYTIIDIDESGGGNCIVWFDELVDIRDFPNGGDQLYIRMAQKELDSVADAKSKKRVLVIVAIFISTVSGMLLLGVIVWYIFRIRRAKRRAQQVNNSLKDSKEESQQEDLELPLFDLVTISAATNNFSSENKIGQGGFGPVYKGELPTGQEIAVKRLSQSSGQGIKEFKNEVILIAKLQHRNLVKLLGGCIQGEERMLIYEYLPNKSLDYFIFDEYTRKLLSWKKRFGIIMGIARGLLYLHQDSRLRIVHRDLKTSNILLDSEMNPKISDFGIARIFGGEQTEEKTKRVIGTYGYMSPEYALSGHFSVKSDVFSFGVLVLEIISGKKNWGFYHPDHDLNLLGHAWKLWNEGNALELMDSLMEDSVSVNEVERCIQVALLCVQLRSEDRPGMSSVVFMLGNYESAMVPQPKEPGFCTENYSIGKDSSSSGHKPHTANEVTMTALDGR